MNQLPEHMKNNFNTTEDLLEKGKNIRLSAIEREEMKSTLLSYAQFHTPKQHPKESPFSLSSIWMRSLASASLAVVLFIGTNFASADSLPGELLYPVKTNILEELVAATKLSPEDKLTYQHERFETRLLEIQTLAEQLSLTETALNDSHVELRELVDELAVLLKEENEVDDLYTLELVGDISAMNMVIETIVLENATQEQRADFENNSDSAEAMYDEEVTSLLTTDNETIEQYISTQLIEISIELAENDLQTDTTAQVNEYVEDAETSLQDQDYQDVVNLVTEAVQLIVTEEYTNDYQDEIAE